MIVKHSESQDLRLEVLSLVKDLKETKGKDFKCLDVGGGINPWLGDLVTHVIDSQITTINTLIQGDVHDPLLWSQFPDNYFDFVNCTHVLEDIRDPAIVIREMTRISSYGFIAVPSRQTENSFIESNYWKGFSHHRWIFKVNSEGVLQSLAKFPATSAPNGFRFASTFWKIPGFKRFLRKFFRRSSWDRTQTFRTTRNLELGIIWRDSFEFSYLDGDFAGTSTDSLIEKFNNFVSPVE